MIRQSLECIAFFSLGDVLGGLQQGDPAVGSLQYPRGTILLLLLLLYYSRA